MTNQERPDGCQHANTKIYDSRVFPVGRTRRRECLDCGQRFSTVEVRREELVQAAEDFDEIQRQAKEFLNRFMPPHYNLLRRVNKQSGDPEE